MGKIKQWIVVHKLLSIIIASVLVVGIMLSIVLPITLSNKVSYEVSKLQFEKALQFKDENDNLYLNWKAECKDKDGNVTRIAQMTENASYAEFKNAQTSTAQYRLWTNANNHGIILQKQNDTKEWIETKKYAGSFVAANLVRLPESFVSPDGDFDNFTYNPEDKTYHYVDNTNAPIALCYDIKFENGKMVSHVYTVKRITNDVETIMAVVSWTFSYGNFQMIVKLLLQQNLHIHKVQTHLQL